MSRGGPLKALALKHASTEPGSEVACKKPDESPESPGEKSSYESEESDIEARVQRALDKLDPSLQAILNVRYGLLNGHPSSASKIAEQIGVKDSQVKSLEDEALRVLMGYYKRNGKLPPGGYSQ